MSRRPALAREPADAPPPEKDRVFLQGGQLFVASGDASAVTILGSCVAVCLFDPIARVGGMNHFLLPLPGEQEPSPRFGDVACAQLVDEVLLGGARRGDLRAKVFGGSGVMGSGDPARPTLGEKNVELALAFLAAEGIPVVHGDVGGARGRKLVFRVGDGAAWVKVL
jgi:chemotaxis protein CheD